MSADLEARARRVLVNVADSMTPTRPSLEELVGRDARRIQPSQPLRDRWRVVTRVAAGMVAVVGAVVTFAVLRGDSGTSERPGPTLVATTPTTSQPIPTSSVPATSVTKRAPDVFEGIPWYVPSAVPDGYDVVDTQAGGPGADLFVNSTTWSSGSIGATGQLRIRADSTPGESMVGGDATVHGVKALVVVGGAVETAKVTWIEHNLSLRLESNIDGLDVVALAERTVVDPSRGISLPADALPEGLQVVADVLPSTSNTSAASISLKLRSADGKLIDYSIGPNLQRDSLARVVAPAASSSLEVIGSQERLVRAPADQDGATTITWFEDGFAYEVHGNESTPIDDLTSFVRGLRRGTIEDFIALTEQASETALQLEAHDAGTFDDGTTVSIRDLTSRLEPSGRLAPAICVQAEVATCGRQRYTEVTENVVAASAMLRSDGQVELVFWHARPASEFSATDSPAGDDLPLDLATGSLGTFVRVVVPPNASTIWFRFTTDPASEPDVEQVFVDDTYIAGT